MIFMKRNLHRLVLPAIVGLVLGVLPAFSYPGQRPPKDSYDASCQYGDSRPTFCRSKIDRVNNILSVWHPATVQSAMIFDYKASCLEPGCKMIGPDFGTIKGPEQYRILQISDEAIQFQSLGDELNEPMNILINIYR